MNKNNLYAIAGVIIVVVVYYFYTAGKKAGGIITYPNNGTGIPSGWSPRPVVVQLQSAFNPSGNSWMTAFDGTNEDLIWSSLNNLTDDQLASVYNDYLQVTGHSILDDLRRELSGDDLTRAMQYFSFINTRWSFNRLSGNLQRIAF